VGTPISISLSISAYMEVKNVRNVIFIIKRNENQKYGKTRTYYLDSNVFYYKFSKVNFRDAHY